MWLGGEGDIRIKGEEVYIHSFMCIYFHLFLAALGLRCYVLASHCGGFSFCGARALSAWASVVVVRWLSSCGLGTLEHRLSSCDARA